MIAQNIIDDILEKIDIVKVIGDDISLKKRGVNYTGLCPFHNERTPSFSVSASKGICKCFSCGKGGNAIWYIQERFGLSYPEAVREAGKQCNVEVPFDYSPEQKQQNDDRASAKLVMTAAHQLFEQNLATPEAAAYLAERKISKQITDLYGLGYAYSYNGLSEKLIAAGYEQKHIINAGVAYYNADKQKLTDFAYQRILFPFYDKMGQVVGYSGRDISGSQTAKYKNTGDTLLFNKGHFVFGLYQARQEIQKADRVYVVEGQFDVLSLAQAGIRNVVASSGTAFSEAQRKLLHAITANVVFLFDGDAAGLAAAQKLLPDFIKDEFKVRCIMLPVGKDPDDMAKLKGAELPAWLVKHEKNYVDYLIKKLYTKEEDEFQKLEKTKQLVGIIALERDEILRKVFLGELAIATTYALDDLTDMASQVKVPEAPARFDNGFFGEEFAKDFIDPEEKEIHLVNDFDRFQVMLGEKEPYVFYSGLPSMGDIQRLAQLANRVVVHSPDMDCNYKRENEDCILMREMFKFGLTVDVVENERTKGFIYYYIEHYGTLRREESPTPEVLNEYIARCAEMISYAKQAIQTVNLPSWSELLGLKLSSLKELIKPFVAERKSKQRLDRERGDVYEGLKDMDSDKLPEYVEESEEYLRMLRRYGFYPLLNKDGVPVSYMFQMGTNSFRRVADFYMEPLFHVHSQNKEENRRVIRINHLYDHRPSYVEWSSSTFTKLTTLQDMLINEGGYNFENGDAKDYAKIWQYMSYNFPKCSEIRVFGQQHEGCFIFANGMFHEVEGKWQFEYCNEFGLMSHQDDIFYSPAFCKINSSVRKDNDRYEQDRWFVYTETPEKKKITFERWAELMDEVYKINDNGKWSLIYAIMSAFRSDIHPINRLFTSIFFIGPTMSGKTQIAISIRSLFIKPDAPSFNLNSGTDAAFFSVMERMRDVPCVMEEYNDEQISDYKFQGLKTATYDGDGKQKRKSATSNDIETSKVNSPLVLLGQEAPQRDDNALSNRVVLCEVPKRESINEERAQQLFQELKDAEKAGLSYLLLEILRLRPLVQSKYAEILKECSRELQSLVESSGSRSGDQTRVILTVSMFLATCKLLETYAPELKLPFTYEEFKQLCVDKIRKQVDMLVKTDKLAMFFNTIDYLIDKGTIKPGRDYKIERPGRVTLKGGYERVLNPADTAVLYINLSNIHKMYAASIPTGEHPLSLTTLEINLNSHPSYLGQVGNTRFKWMEVKEVPAGGMIRDPATGEEKPNMFMHRVMENKTKQTSAVLLNYDILSKMMGIDFERIEHPINTEPKLQFK
ncbi:MAG: DNA primase [Phocaeicola sp.]